MCPLLLQDAGKVFVHLPGKTQHLSAVQDEPVWVSLAEAQAYCHWAGGRIMTEPEYELAASQDNRLHYAGVHIGVVYAAVAGCDMQQMLNSVPIISKLMLSSKGGLYAAQVQVLSVVCTNTKLFLVHQFFLACLNAVSCSC